MLRRLPDRCGALQCISGNVAEGLQTTVELYGACIASSAPCGGVHHILSPIIAVHYGNVTESLRTMGTLTDNCGALRCTTVHRGNVAEALRTIGMLPNHYSSLRRIAVQVVHVAAECITDGNAKIPSTSPIIRLIHKSP